MPLTIAADPNRTKQPMITVAPKRQFIRPVSIMKPTMATAITATAVATLPSRVPWSHISAATIGPEPCGSTCPAAAAGALARIIGTAARPRVIFIDFLPWSLMRCDARWSSHRLGFLRLRGLRRHFGLVPVRHCRRRVPFPHFRQIDQGVGEDIARRRRDFGGGRPD